MVELRLELTPASEAEDVEEMLREVRALRREMINLDVDDVQPPPKSDSPPGSRGVDYGRRGLGERGEGDPRAKDRAGRRQGHCQRQVTADCAAGFDAVVLRQFKQLLQTHPGEMQFQIVALLVERTPDGVPRRY